MNKYKKLSLQKEIEKEAKKNRKGSIRGSGFKRYTSFG